MLRVRSLAILVLVVAIACIPDSAALAKKGRRSASTRPLAAEILMDARSGAVISARNADTLTYPASLTKMMTLLLTFEALDQGRLRLDQRLPVSRHAAGMAPSKLGLGVGSTIRVEDAILALVTKSANDAAVVLAEAIGGSESAFAERMTRRAKALGMRRTVFRNASGLPNAAQRTTARDMAILAKALVDRPARHYAYFSRRSFDWQGHRVYGHNRLMARYPGMDGLKTGYIAASGFNLAASAVRDGRRLIAVVLGGQSAALRDARVAALLDSGFRSAPRAPAPRVPDALVASVGSSSHMDRAVADDSRNDDGRDDGGEDGEVMATTVSTAPAGAGPVGHAAGGRRGWSIQVGAFSTNAAARRTATAAADELGRLAAGSRPLVVSADGVHKAQVTGFGSGAAAAACEILKAKGQDCFTVRAP
ncbi:D-alanyl-D-alanine carboxypeptidase family protein [Azospirillum thermophilum]|uniref:D-alanyl-D-alanine carboxypeptidase n=1 Tax=Azospirillum thermophilum TaxID=2202148 RepID=A0A2S2CWG1_9PROT|nr:D-alanyl-D-alanine carboxypeptidase family protein [Azospirillum thermophilum]AWK88745.1 D-alanyl-D-alanine carboxypeptidase [Azospirillum thermophilum]